MRYKRDESFRYMFDGPLTGWIQLIKVYNHPTHSSVGQVEIIDISPEGMRLHTDLDLLEKAIELEVKFTLNNEEITLIGDVIWKKQVGTEFDYGLQLNISEDEKDFLIKQIKEHVKRTIT